MNLESFSNQNTSPEIPDLDAPENVKELLLLYQSVITASTELSIICENEKGTLVLWNEGARRNYGYTAEEAVGRMSADLLHSPEGRESGLHVEMRKIALETGKWEGIVERLRKDGTRFTTRVIMTPRRGTDGKPAGFVTFSKDITEQLEMERRRKEAEKRVKALNKELEAFSYSVSHDLRAPLRHISGFVSLLQESAGDELNAKSRRYLNTIADSAKQMGRLIDDLLTFSRMGRAEMARVDLDLNLVVQPIIRSLEADNRDRNIQWKIRPLPTVQADPPMLRQVFANLLDNAVKYTRGRDPAEIEIGSTEEDDGVTVFIKDNGAGFDMEYVDKLFGVFQRLHRADEFEGTGIGLANVKRIVSRHDGRVWATGKLKEGATFYFSLPRHPRPPSSKNGKEKNESA